MITVRTELLPGIRGVRNIDVAGKDPEYFDTHLLYAPGGWPRMVTTLNIYAEVHHYVSNHDKVRIPLDH